MSRKSLSLATIATLDGGRLGRAFDLELQNVEDDLRDRPGVGAKRTVTLTVTMNPAADEEGNLETIGVGFDIKSSMPKRASRTYIADAARRRGAGGGILLNEDLDEDDAPGQTTIDEHGESDGETGLRAVNQ